MATTNNNFKVKNGLDAGGAVTSAGLSLLSTTSPITLNGSAGTSGQVLTSAGAGATPTWGTVSLGYVGSFQTTASASGPITISVPAVASGAANTVTLQGGDQSSTAASAGAVSITGGSQTSSSTIRTGGNITVSGGAATNGSGGSVTIKGGTGLQGNGAVYIGTTNPAGIEFGTNAYTNNIYGVTNFSGTTSPIQLNSSAGTSGQVLASAGAGATPTWINVGGSITTGAQSFSGDKTFNNNINVLGNIQNATIADGGLFSFYGYSTASGTTTLTNVPGTTGFATTNPSMLIAVTQANAANNTGKVGAEFRSNTSTGTTYLITFSSATTARGSISTTGTSTAYTTSSDYRLKENIQPITNALDRLRLLKPSRFNFIEFPEKTVDGFIAHEAQKVVPESVTGEKDELGSNGLPAYQGIDQAKLVPLITAALQEAILKIESLENRIKKLEK